MLRRFKALIAISAVGWLAGAASAQTTPAPAPQPAAPVTSQTPTPQPEDAVVTQTPPPPPQRRPSVLPANVDRLRLMQTVAAALGVECAYCHNNLERRGRPVPLTDSGKPRMEVAREMFLMVDEINKTVQAATEKTAADVTRVQCVTCHRGVPVPKPLADILIQTALKDGPDAAATQMHDLRAKYYGTQAYDFSERGMIALGERLVNARPQAAVALMQASLQYYPQSSTIYMMLGIAQGNASDYQRGVESLRKSLELDPTNNLARGRLAQLEAQTRPRPR